MNEPFHAPQPPVVVTPAEVERIFRGSESAINEAVQEGAQEIGMDAARALATVGAILTELRKAQQAHGDSRIMVTAQHGPASRIQAAIAEGEGGSLKLSPLPSGGLEAKFDTHEWAKWAREVAWAKIRNPRKFPIIRPTAGDGISSLPDSIRVGLLGDWGTGLYGAPRIARAIREDREPFDVLMHLGDVYYAGSEREIKSRFLDLWPTEIKAVHRALNGNHEMYSGGHPYFERVLPGFHQDASYFAFQNTHWTLIGLDLAYLDHAIDDAQVGWIESVLNQAGRRKVVFFSHHQPFSHFDSQGPKLWAHPGFERILTSQRVFAWYWGHEHRCCLFEEREHRSGIWGRCIGHGGMPESRQLTHLLPKAPEQTLADWRRAAARRDQAGNIIPAALILEGTNIYLGDESDKFLPHGYAVLRFDGPTLHEQVLDPEGRVQFQQTLASA